MCGIVAGRYRASFCSHGAVSPCFGALLRHGDTAPWLHGRVLNKAYGTDANDLLPENLWNVANLRGETACFSVVDWQQDSWGWLSADEIRVLGEPVPYDGEPHPTPPQRHGAESGEPCVEMLGARAAARAPEREQGGRELFPVGRGPAAVLAVDATAFQKPDEVLALEREGLADGVHQSGLRLAGAHRGVRPAQLRQAVSECGVGHVFHGSIIRCPRI